jgi:hypothetical protein
MMNRLEYLPDELQEKIYYETHKLKCKDVFEDIKEFKHKQICYNYDCYLIMIETLYNSEMSQKELGDYFVALDRINGKTFDTMIEVLIVNKYYNLYFDTLALYF